MAKKDSQQVLTGTNTSSSLSQGHVYSRKDLSTQFQIVDANINNGIFKPAAFDSVWIFVTETKTADKTQYEDVLIGDELRMEGQTEGRTDYLLEKHVERGLEVLLFYRTKKNQHPGYGFTYKGRFLYQSQSGSRPTKFVLRHESSPLLNASVVEEELAESGEFDPQNIIDARKKVIASVVRRKGQGKFRAALLKAYKGRCAVTGCTIEALLEAAHIVPYLGDETNVVSNGLLLRADIHTLFDLRLLWIDPENRTVKLAEPLIGSEYEEWANKALYAPENSSDWPSVKALKSQFNTLQLSAGSSGNPQPSGSLNAPDDSIPSDVDQEHQMLAATLK
ncbi:HNH endonuclease [Pseudomonas sp. Pseu.R1]|uniref:HNH endonuclease n=1 Tax=Pseudomonas sp. Pseu.R1 TaxID=3379818 RepID=UPI003B95ABD6